MVFTGKDLRIIVFGFRARTKQVIFINNSSFGMNFFFWYICAVIIVVIPACYTLPIGHSLVIDYRLPGELGGWLTNGCLTMNLS